MIWRSNHFLDCSCDPSEWGLLSMGNVLADSAKGSELYPELLPV